MCQPTFSTLTQNNSKNSTHIKWKTFSNCSMHTTRKRQRRRRRRRQIRRTLALWWNYISTGRRHRHRRRLQKKLTQKLLHFFHGTKSILIYTFADKITTPVQLPNLFISWLMQRNEIQYRSISTYTYTHPMIAITKMHTLTQMIILMENSQLTPNWMARYCSYSFLDPLSLSLFHFLSYSFIFRSFCWDCWKFPR